MPIINLITVDDIKKGMSDGDRFQVGNVWGQIFMTHIFSLLAAYDLYSASLTNKYFFQRSTIMKVMISAHHDIKLRR